MMKDVTSKDRHHHHFKLEVLLICLIGLVLHWYEVWSTTTPKIGMVMTTMKEMEIEQPPTTTATPSLSYVLLAVSGTLEEGFELRANLDYRVGPNNNNRVNATFLGKALVRGYKSFLDIKNPTWREYKEDGDDGDNGILKTVNPAIVPTGCHEHANRYSIYAVDSRQIILALAGEPRFLAIAPDMGLVDLTTTTTTTATADDLTSPTIKKLVYAYVKQERQQVSFGGGDDDDDDKRATTTSSSYAPSPTMPTKVAFLTVTSTYLKSTFVPNGIIRQEKDGTFITDFAESTAIWSKDILNNNTKNYPHPQFPEGCGSDPTGGQVINVDTAENYKICIDQAIRIQESDFTIVDGQQVGDLLDYEFCSHQSRTKSCFPCQVQARYGVDDDHTIRFNKIFEACELEKLLIEAGMTNRDGSPGFRLQGCSHHSDEMGG